MTSLTTVPTEILIEIAANCETLGDLHALALTSHLFLEVCINTPRSALYRMFKASYPLNSTDRYPPELLLLAATKAQQLSEWITASKTPLTKFDHSLMSLDYLCREILSILPLTLDDLGRVQSFLHEEIKTAAENAKFAVKKNMTGFREWGYKTSTSEETESSDESALYFAIVFCKVHLGLRHCNLPKETYELISLVIAPR